MCVCTCYRHYSNRTVDPMSRRNSIFGIFVNPIMWKAVPLIISSESYQNNAYEVTTSSVVVHPGVFLSKQVLTHNSWQRERCSED